jgi:hypothetical protein
MSKIRAKFTAMSKTLYGTAGQGNVKLQPVYSTDPASENKAFWSATPSGTIELGGLSAEVLARFELGKEYYVDFTPADAAEEAADPYKVSDRQQNGA